MSDSQGTPVALDWYYLEEGGSCGPVPASQLRQLMASGVLSPDTLVWREGMTDWLPASELGLTVRAVPPPPPPPAVKQSADATPRRVEPRGRGLPTADHLPNPALARTSPASRTERRPSSNSTPWLWMVISAVSLLVAGLAIGYALRHDSSATVARDDVGRTGRSSTSIPPPNSPRPRSPNNAAPSHRPDSNGEPPNEFAADARQHMSADSTASPFRTADAGPAGRDVAGAEHDLTAPAAAKDVSMTGDESGPPEMLFQEIDMHRRPSFGITGGATVQDIRYLILSRLNLQPRQADGTRTVTQQVLDTRLDRADDMSRLALNANLERLKGKTFVYKLGELGDVVKFTGYDRGAGALPVGREGMSGFLLADVLDEDGWKEMTHLSFLEPDKHIAPGQPWTRQIVHDWGQVGSWSGVTTYSQDSAVGSNLRFRYTHNLTYKPPSSTVSGLLPFNIGDPDFHLLEASGWFLYNPTAQHVTEAHETFHVKGGFGSELLGGAAKIEIEERQEVSIRLTRQNPW